MKATTIDAWNVLDRFASKSAPASRSAMRDNGIEPAASRRNLSLTGLVRFPKTETVFLISPST
jgi:hypothetical protein